ncbi:hypothetical protein B0H14DRAFT_2582802 [Mycena olivaceomarginata]|nr:hypothetical protein B0H14DRAFT_2582802 [Mycena olivaceomarginata]
MYLITGVKPADDLLPVLQNINVQQKVFLSLRLRLPPSAILRLLAQTFSPLPSDLSAVWEDLHFILGLALRPRGSISDNFDATYDNMYIQILSQNSGALLILRMILAEPAAYTQPGKKSMTLWTCHVSVVFDKLLSMSETLPRRLNIWVAIIGLCTPSDVVLHALENLDATQFCARIYSDPKHHSRFPSPPQQAIEYWERQVVALETCRQSLQDKQSRSEDSEDEDMSDKEEFDNDDEKEHFLQEAESERSESKDSEDEDSSGEDQFDKDVEEEE